MILHSPTEQYPSQFLNTDQTDVVRLETVQEERERKQVFLANTYGPLAVKAALVAPALGGVMIAFPAAAVLVAAAYFAIQRNFDTAYADKRTDEWRDRVLQHTDDPNFLKDYDMIARKAGLRDSPPLLISETSPHAIHMSYIGKGRNAITLGTGMFSQFNKNELRALLAHEMTHVRLDHVKGAINRTPTHLAGLLLNAVAIGGAIFGALPLLPVIGAIAGLSLVQTTIYSIQSRKEEKIADRGTQLICGGGKDMVSGLRKYNDLLKKHKPAKASMLKKALLLLPTKYQPAAERVRGFIERTHPLIAKREQLLDVFERQHPAFCDSRRAAFSMQFNTVAHKPNSDLPEFSVNRMKYQIKTMN